MSYLPSHHSEVCTVGFNYEFYLIKLAGDPWLTAWLIFFWLPLCAALRWVMAEFGVWRCCGFSFIFYFVILPSSQHPFLAGDKRLGFFICFSGDANFRCCFTLPSLILANSAALVCLSVNSWSLEEGGAGEAVRNIEGKAWTLWTCPRCLQERRRRRWPHRKMCFISPQLQTGRKRWQLRPVVTTNRFTARSYSAGLNLKERLIYPR